MLTMIIVSKGMIMFVTRRSPMHRTQRSAGGGAAEAIFFILTGIGALGGLIWVIAEL